MSAQKIPQLNPHSPADESSRLRIALIVIGVLLALTLVYGIFAVNLQPFVFILALVAMVGISWMWSVGVDRVYHRLRHWNRSQAPQPVSRLESRATVTRLPLRQVSEGPASVSFKNFVQQGYIPTVLAFAGSSDVSERLAAIKYEAARALARLAESLEGCGRADEARIVRSDAQKYGHELLNAGEGEAGKVPEVAADALSEALKSARAGRYEEAVKAIEDMPAKQRPGAALYSLGVSYGMLGNLDKAAEILLKAADAGSESASLRLALGVIYAEQGQYDKALKQIRASLTMDSECAAAYAALGEVLIAHGDLTSAREALDDALSLDGEMPLARSARGRLIYDRGDAAAAVRDIERAFGADPGNADLCYNLAAALAASEKYDEIAAKLAEAADTSNDPRMIQIVADAFEKTGQPEKSRKLLERSAEIEPQGGSARLKLARSLRDQGKLQEARSELQAMITENPRSAEAIAETAVIDEMLGDKEQALAGYRRAAQLNKTNGVALLGLGRILVQSGQVREAIGYLKQAVSLPDAGADARYWLGVAQLECGKPLIALEALREATRMAAGQRGDITYALGRALLKAGRAKEAAEELRRAKKILADVPEVDRDLGYALHQTRNYQEAEKSLRGYLAAKPDASDAAEVQNLADSLKWDGTNRI